MNYTRRQVLAIVIVTTVFSVIALIVLTPWLTALTGGAWEGIAFRP